jgi:hypothetical protein
MPVEHLTNHHLLVPFQTEQSYCPSPHHLHSSLSLPTPLCSPLKTVGVDHVSVSSSADGENERELVGPPLVVADWLWQSPHFALFLFRDSPPVMGCNSLPCPCWCPGAREEAVAIKN